MGVEVQSLDMFDRHFSTQVAADAGLPIIILPDRSSDPWILRHQRGPFKTHNGGHDVKMYSMFNHMFFGDQGATVQLLFLPKNVVC